uniref:NACHT domain-containing protein n=1 Tax=Pseudictyota dubia TaxID=2749911 RepID=A0A7R9W9E9_9STRA|mmetsp:Transcript_38109/g.70299  ORF Transcript_38109/g.70299 Transcript_38109/m.70299 type:complete len:1345 (+) Transcript_38109:445-4479(+)
MSEFPSPPRLGRYCSLGFNELCLNSDGSTMSREQIVRERQKRGLCTTCHDHPTQCFERVVPRGGRAARIVRIVRGAALTPRNEEGVVRDGVCLRCNPPAIRTASRLSSSGSNGRQEQQHNEGGTRIERNAAEDTIASREHSPGTTSRHHHTSGASASNLETSGSGSMGSGLGSTGTAYFGSGYHSSGSNSRSENDPHHIDVSNNISHSITNISIEADCAVNGAPPPSSAGSNTASSTLLEREMSSPRTMPEAGTDEEGVGRRHHHNMERTETLSESGALAGCSSASAPQAQLDDSRQSSHSLAPPYHAAATEEYLEQAMMRQRHNILTVFQASPLVHEDDRGRIHPFEDRLDFGREREIIIESFSRAGSNVRAVFETGTTEMLSDLLANDSHGETCQVLHFSCRCGNGFLYLEDGKGGAHLVSVNDLLDFIKASGRTVLFVFIFPFHSFFAGEAFLEAGARHVVCCRGDKKLRDNTVKVFCRAFYTALASGTTLKGAFELGKYAVKMSPVLSPHSEEEMNKLILLPEDVACHDVPVFSMDNEQHAFTLSNSQQGEPWILCHPPEQFIGREKETYNIIGALHKFRLVRLIGPPGVGKTSLAAAVCQYIKPRRKSFGLQEIIWLPLIQLSHEDELTTSLLLLFELLQVKGIHDYSANGEYWKACHTIIGALQRTKAVIVVDAQYVNFEGLSMFLKELLRRTEHVRIILINNEASESSLSIGVAETTITVHPLSFRHSVMLFGAVCPFMSGSHTALTPSNLYSILVSDDEDEYRAGDEGLSERGEKTLQFIGEGIPAKVIIAAEIVKNEWLNKLVNLSKIEQNDFTNGKMTELSELAGEMIESVKNQEGIKKLGISDASSLPSFRETDGSSLEDDYLLVGVDFSTAFRDMDQDWAKNIVRQRKLIDAHLKDLLERSRRLTDEVDEPRKVLVEYVDNHRRERALVTLKMDIDIPSVGLDSLNRLKIQRCCQKIASLLRQAGVPDDELEQIMLGTLWQGSLNILLVAPSGVFVKLHSILLDGEKNIDLGDDEYLVSVRPAFVMKPTPTSLGRNLRIDVLRSISGNAEAEKGELTKGDSLFLVPTSPGASANILTGVVALLGEKRERDWIHLLPFHYKKIGMGWEAVEDEKGSAGVVEAMEASVGMSSAAAMMEVAKAAEVKESATIATESTSETWSAPPEIASALLRLSTAATADDVATACTDIGNLAKMAEMRAAIEAYNNADNIVAIGIPAIVAAIPAIVSAMERHGESAAVQEKAIAALRNLALDDGNRAKIVTAGAIPAIVAAMKQHAEVAAVQENACKALYNLSKLSSNMPLMRSEGVQQLLEYAKRRFPSQCDRPASHVLQKL